ncbi:hypothetical protein AVEN_8131-1 [Araneus ventricosus]|uniref:Tc1-like transposase DDE domain-containing protein n=1 Tax=Araneus ventricosus TaxID=182803 RepID=A0A4Y2QXB5_ARAVE|nr:hypothetical protein AVEN_8131-1 [Araneus ventricosus]
MVCADIILNVLIAALHIFTSAVMNAEIYRYEVLGPHFQLFRGIIGNNFLLMDNNAYPHHTALLTDKCEDKGIQRMEWPAYFQDGRTCVRSARTSTCITATPT